MTKKGKIKWSIILMATLVLGIWISTRWNTWFGNPPEPSYTPAGEPHRILLTMGAKGGNSRIVTWQADTMPQDGSIWLQDSTANTREIKATCEVVHTRGGKTAFYRADLGELAHTDNGYKFCVTSGKKKSGWYSFNIPPKKESVSFIFMGDVQDTVNGISKQIFNKIDQKNADADFWLFGGDLVERPIDDFWQVAFNDLDSIGTRKPILGISGNHEYLKGLVKELDPRFGHVFGYYLDSKVGDNHVFSFSYGDARFFLLDSNTDSWNLPTQRRWLRAELEKSTEKWKIVVLHHPLYSNKGKHYNPMVKWAFGNLVKEFNVDLVLQAHEHVYARWNEKDAQDNPLAPLYLSTYASPKQYQMFFDVPEDRIGTNDRFYQRISYNADSLTIWTFTGSNHEAYDHVCITKDKTYQVTDFFKGKPQKVEISDWFRTNKKKHLQEYEKDIDTWEKKQ